MIIDRDDRILKLERIVEGRINRQKEILSGLDDYGQILRTIIEIEVWEPYMEKIFVEMEEHAKGWAAEAGNLEKETDPKKKGGIS